jgi:hypothetical protein
VIEYSFELAIQGVEPDFQSRLAETFRGEYVLSSLLSSKRGRFAYRVLHSAMLLCLSFSAAVLSLAQSNQRVSPWQQKTLAGAFSTTRTIPRAEHGYLVSFRRSNLPGGGGNIFLRSLADGDELPITFWVRDASEIRLEDVATSAMGQIYVAGSSVRQGEMAPTNFVAEIDRQGNVSQLVDLGPYAPKRVCAANDGTFWTFGVGLGGLGEDQRGERLLRQYSPDGHLLGAYLPSIKFPALSRYGFRRAAVTLVCGDESVGVYLAKPARWIEVQSGTAIAYKWRIASPPPGTITTAVLMRSHQVYAAFATKTMGADGKPSLHSLMYQLSLPGNEQGPVFSGGGTVNGSVVFSNKSHSGTRPKGIWVPLAGGSADTSVSAILVGRDNGSLVYVEPRVPGSDPTFSWVRP